MAGPGRREDALHHPGIALGERLQRKLQRVIARRASKWRDLLQSGRSQSADRGLAAALQHNPTAQQPRLPTAGPGNRDTAIAAFRFRYAPPPAGNGQEGSNALTFNPDHLMGADHATIVSGANIIPATINGIEIKLIKNGFFATCQ